MDRRGQAARAWAVGLGVLALGFWSRGRVPATVQAAATAAALAVGLVAAALAPAFAGPVRGLAAGALAFAFVSVGGCLPGLSAWDSNATQTFRYRRRRSTLIASALVLGLGSTITWVVALGQTPGGPTPKPPILVLYPYDGPPDASRPPGQALLRLSDYESLRSSTRRRPRCDFLHDGHRHVSLAPGSSSGGVGPGGVRFHSYCR